MVTQSEDRPAASRVAPALLWFATLGGAVSWSVHLVVGWGLEEIACGSGSIGSDIMGASLITWLAWLTAVLGVVDLAALGLSWRLWRRAGEPGHTGEPPVGRAGFMALIGMLSNGLFLLMIIYGGISLLFLGPCLS